MANPVAYFSLRYSTPSWPQSCRSGERDGLPIMQVIIQIICDPLSWNFILIFICIPQNPAKKADRFLSQIWRTVYLSSSDLKQKMKKESRSKIFQAPERPGKTTFIIMLSLLSANKIDYNPIE